MDEIRITKQPFPIKDIKHLIFVVVLAFLVVIALCVMLAQLVMRGSDLSTGPAMSDAEVAKRLQPAGTVAFSDSKAPDTKPAPPAAGAAPSAPPAAVAAAPASSGKDVYDKNCIACHAAGVAGAPKTGDKAAWAPRVAGGIGALYTNSLKGKNAMPPKGGNSTLADADVKAAVDYMVGLVK